MSIANSEDEPLPWGGLPSAELERLIKKACNSKTWGWSSCLAWVKTGDIRNVALVQWQEEHWHNRNQAVSFAAANILAEEMSALPTGATRSDLLCAVEQGRIVMHGRVSPEEASCVIPADLLRGCDVWLTSQSWCLGSARDQYTVWFYDVAFDRADVCREFPGDSLVETRAGIAIKVDDQSFRGKLPLSAKPVNRRHEEAAHYAAKIVRENGCAVAEGIRQSRGLVEIANRDIDNVDRATRAAYDLMYNKHGQPIQN